MMYVQGSRITSARARGAKLGSTPKDLQYLTASLVVCRLLSLIRQNRLYHQTLIRCSSLRMWKHTMARSAELVSWSESLT
jgi:hypothetical protein